MSDIEQLVSDGLQGLVPEPPLSLSGHDLATTGRRRQQRRRAGGAALAVVAVVVVGAALSTGALHHSSAPPTGSNLPTRTVDVTWSTRVKPDASWHQTAVIPYGAGLHDLGRGQANGVCSSGCGPESAAPAPDGTWWIDDIIKNRFVNVTRSGQFLGDVPLPSTVTEADGLAVLSDGTLLAFDNRNLITVTDGQVKVLPTSGIVQATGSVHYVDGQTAYTDGVSKNAGRVSLQKITISDSSAHVGGGSSPIGVEYSRGRTEITYGGHRTLLDLGDYPTAGVEVTMGEDHHEIYVQLSGSKTGLASDPGVSSLLRIADNGVVQQQQGFSVRAGSSDDATTLRSTDGVVGFGIAYRDGFHLYERIAMAPAIPAGSSAAVEPASPGGPCTAQVKAGTVLSVAVSSEGVAVARCSVALRTQQLRFSNLTWHPVSVRLGRFGFVLEPGGSHLIDATAGSYLATGRHLVHVAGTTDTTFVLVQ